MDIGPIEKCANRIRKALSIRGMRQYELCEKTKIPKSAMSQYVNGSFEPKQDRVFLIARALNVDPVWLMGYDVPMEVKEEPTMKVDSPSEPQLTGVDKELFELLKRIPEDKKRMFLQLGRVFEENLNKE